MAVVECIKPVVGGDSCQAAHLGYVVPGQLHIASTDGSELDLGPGDAYRLEPGHDAWVVGDEAAVLIDFGPSPAYASWSPGADLSSHPPV